MFVCNPSPSGIFKGGLQVGVVLIFLRQDGGGDVLGTTPSLRHGVFPPWAHGHDGTSRTLHGWTWTYGRFGSTELSSVSACLSSMVDWTLKVKYLSICLFVMGLSVPVSKFHLVCCAFLCLCLSAFLCLPVCIPLSLPVCM